MNENIPYIVILIGAIAFIVAISGSFKKKHEKPHKHAH